MVLHSLLSDSPVTPKAQRILVEKNIPNEPQRAPVDRIDSAAKLGHPFSLIYVTRKFPIKA
jgi:hypothetical protein